MSDYSELKRLAEEMSATRISSPNAVRLLANWAKAVNPQTIAALIDENERLEITKKALLSERKAMMAQLEPLRSEVEALRKQIDEMSPLKGAPLTGPDLKCLACGGYHYGMSGLPCPKMAPMAFGEKGDA